MAKNISKKSSKNSNVVLVNLAKELDMAKANLEVAVAHYGERKTRQRREAVEQLTATVEAAEKKLATTTAALKNATEVKAPKKDAEEDDETIPPGTRVLVVFDISSNTADVCGDYKGEDGVVLIQATVLKFQKGFYLLDYGFLESDAAWLQAGPSDVFPKSKEGRAAADVRVERVRLQNRAFEAWTGYEAALVAGLTATDNAVNIVNAWDKLSANVQKGIKSFLGIKGQVSETVAKSAWEKMWTVAGKKAQKDLTAKREEQRAGAADAVASFKAEWISEAVIDAALDCDTYPLVRDVLRVKGDETARLAKEATPVKKSKSVAKGSKKAAALDLGGRGGASYPDQGGGPTGQPLWPA